MKWRRGSFCKSIWRITINTDQASSAAQVQVTGEGSAVPPSLAGRARFILRWMWAHKLKTILFIILVFFIAELVSIPFFNIAHLKTERPGETALMRQRLNEARSKEEPLKFVQHWIPLSRLPKHVIDAVIVAEDGTFYTHGGIDWFEVQESIEKNIHERRAARGASTITQQLAKNLYLSTSKDPVRKVKELIITFLLERELSKDRILELYLNVIEWGRGIFGIEAAAETYFGKSASRLSLDEATRLAAVIPSPLRHPPNADSRYVLRRKQIVLSRLSAKNALHQSSTEDVSSNPSLNKLPQITGPGGVTDQATDTDTTEKDEDENNGL